MGDRWFYTHSDSGFSSDQVKEIKVMTFARFLCDNVQDLNTVPRNAFKTEDVINCREVPRVRWEKFKDIQKHAKPKLADPA